VLFGASTPFAKILLGHMDPWMLAGLLYLGSGAGLFVVRAARRLSGAKAEGEAGIGGTGWLWLAGAILAGGVAGPVLLMVGLAQTTAAAASLLLNLEGVFTVLLAWFVFGENFDRRIALGMAAIALGGLVLSWQGQPSVAGLLGPLAIAGGCFAWALDNNLTRRVSLSDPMQVAMLKGLVAGAINLALALFRGAPVPDAGIVAAAGLVGLFGYGFSLVLFVLALRHLGAARTGAYFSTAPFIGAAIALVGFGEAVTVQLAAAGALMAFGVWLHLTERHDHGHEHAALEHTHRHNHDEHHRHVHSSSDPAGEPHVHPHRHARLRHAHPHYPDAHHDHRH
jgi:drug/metabolite transporter (DMT)-like permease